MSICSNSVVAESSAALRVNRDPTPLAQDAKGMSAKIVAPGYLRTFHPEYLVALAQQVKSGQASAQDLIDVAGGSLATRLLQSNLDLLKSKTQGVLTTLNELVTPPSSGLTLPASDYSPQQIDEQNLYVGEALNFTVKFVAPINDSVSISTTGKVAPIATVSGFQSDTGLYTLAQGTTNDYVPQPAQTVPGNGPLPVTAGQDCQFQVKLHFTAEGTFTGRITVTGSLWSFTVPLSLKASLATGTSASARYNNNDPTVYRDHPFDLKVTVTPHNYKTPFAAIINPIGFPSSITASPTTVVFNSNAPMQAVIHCSASATAPLGNQQLHFNVTTPGGATNPLKIDVPIHLFQIVVDGHPVGSTFSYQASWNVGSWKNTWENPALIIDAAGKWTVTGKMVQSVTGSAKAESYAVAAFGVVYETNPSSGIGGSFSKDKVHLGPFSFGGTSNWLKSNFGAKFLKETARFWIYSEEIKPGPGGSITIPYATPFTVYPW